MKFDDIGNGIAPIDCRNNAINFSRERFQCELREYIANKWGLFNENKAITY